MSAAVRALSSLAAGELPADEGLLHNASLEGWGSQAYGEEAIMEAVRAHPENASDWDAVVGQDGIALFADGIALIADVYEERLHRIWRLGPGTRLPREPGVFVSFDPDLMQSRGAVFVGDHHVAAEIAQAAGRLVLAEMSGFRTRAFALRAFGAGGDLALLFAVYRMGEGPARKCGFSYAAVRLRVADRAIIDARVVRDLVGEQAVAEEPMVPRL